MPSGRKIEISLVVSAIYNSGNQTRLGAWDGTVGSGAYLGGAIHGGAAGVQVAAGEVLKTVRTLTAGAHTINASMKTGSGGGTATLETGAYSDTNTLMPAKLIIKLV